MTFWENLQKLVDKHEIEIDRSKGSAHPNYPEYIYPFNYGYLKNTQSSDGHNIDVWIGSLETNEVTAIINVLDATKGDSEIKILLGCTTEDMEKILQCHKRGSMDGLLISKE